MSDDELRILAITAITSLLTSGKLSFPLPSMSLLARVVATRIPSGLLVNPKARFRLTDQSRFESILENLSRTWTQGTISLSRENGEMAILDIVLEPGECLIPSAEGPSNDAVNSRKRKRVVDEDADSAAGDEETEYSFEDANLSQPTTTLERLSKEMREVYTILQKSTARGRLLAEQVCSPCLSPSSAD